MKVHRGLPKLPHFDKPVITFGSFDGIHNGHKMILKNVVAQAKKLDRDSIVISFDPHPREVIYPKDKTLQLISTIDEKKTILESIGIDHFVLIPFKVEFSQISPQEYIEKVIIEKFDPHHIIIGYDHRFGLNRAGGYEMLKEYGDEAGFTVEVIEEQKINNINISSTKIRNALNEGNTSLASQLLGYPYQLTGKVVDGEKLGRQIGYPTANLVIDHPKKLIPKDGIYAVRAEVNSTAYEGMLYIGDKSTVSKDGKKCIEINIFDFDEDIYGDNVTIQFYKKIRDDEKFNGLEALTAAISLDKQAAQSYFRSISNSETQSLATIAILNWNGQEMMESYLPKVLYSSQNSFETTVIDNKSTDDSVEFLEEWHPEINIIQLEQNLGFAEGYNQGIVLINTKYTVLLNSDVLVTHNWLDPILKMMEADDTIAACQPKIKSLEEKDHFEYAGAGGGMMDRLGYPFCRGRIFDHVEKDVGQYDDIQDVFWISGAAMVIRTDLYKKFEGLDGSYFAHHEEIDLCWRLKNAGYKLIYNPESTVYHLGGGTLQYDSPRKTYLNYKNNITTIIKNESKGKLLSSLLVRSVLDLSSSFVFLLQGHFSRFIPIWRAYFFNATHIIQSLRKRRKNRQLTQRFKIGDPNTFGREDMVLPWRYFINKKRTYSDLS